ncbi:hypothetical protein [Chryseobacterium arthrosphaerae]|uniref:hypothetical protein n=1 Tax=Chryseobacterium arthrosphaerae TaxID=651561 RepID=UPI001F4A9D1A|nr:hypothetical protein [Chryseobacterium arthrosphaerae]
MNDFTNNLKVFFSKTGDSQLQKCIYNNGKINIGVNLSNDELLEMEFLTEIVYIRKINQINPFNIGYLNCIKLSQVLDVENNHYTFSGDFISIMKAQKNKLNLALGLNINKYSHMITFSNSEINLAFIISEKDAYKCNIK